MTTLLHVFNKLRRPKLLIRTARFGSAEFQRDRDLKRLLKAASLPRPGMGMPRLLALEQDLEENRQTGNATYSISRHVEILAALMTEAKFVTKNSPA